MTPQVVGCLFWGELLPIKAINTVRRIILYWHPMKNLQTDFRVGDPVNQSTATETKTDSGGSLGHE